MAATEQLEHGVLTVLQPDETKAMLDRGEILLIDVRNPDEWARARVAGAVLRPLPQFDPADVEAEGKKVVLMCAGGIRSKAAADMLLAAGADDIAHVDGGLKAWYEDGLPVEFGEPGR